MPDIQIPPLGTPTKVGESQGTLKAVEYAAIHLRVPCSGSAWLDAMIAESRKLDLAATTMPASTQPSKPLKASAKETTT